MKKALGWVILANLALGGASASAGEGAVIETPTTEPPSAATASDAKSPPTLSLNTGPDANSRRGVGGYAGVTFAPFEGGLDKSGLRLRVDAADGSFYYNEEGNPQNGEPLLLSVHGHYINAGAAVGYAYISDKLYASAFIGGNYQYVSLSHQDQGNSTVGTRWGFKASVDADYKPIDSVSLLIAGNYSTANNSWWSRFRPGYEIAPEVYAGPEVGFMGNNFWRQLFWGAHLRGLKFGNVEIGLGTGVLRDSQLRWGAYGSVELALRF